MDIKLATILLLLCFKSQAQLPPSPDSLTLLNLNRQIDQLVVRQDVTGLDSLYADDFVFSHGSGRIEGKAGWLRTVGRTKYGVRSHDSVMVEQHGELAILKGAMYIERKAKEKGEPDARYRLKYIRIFSQRSGKWQLVSHTTTWETHL